ncbi:MAG: hypothetical protein AAF989_07760, partial [Planctomycetota bacterium]
SELAPLNPVYLGNLIRTRIRLGETDESVVAQLQELRFIEQREDWILWIDRQLALELNPTLDRGPEVQLTSALDSDQVTRERAVNESVPLNPPLARSHETHQPSERMLRQDGAAPFDPERFDSVDFDPKGNTFLAPPR